VSACWSCMRVLRTCTRGHCTTGPSAWPSCAHTRSAHLPAEPDRCLLHDQHGELAVCACPSHAHSPASQGLTHLEVLGCATLLTPIQLFSQVLIPNNKALLDILAAATAARAPVAPAGRRFGVLSFATLHAGRFVLQHSSQWLSRLQVRLCSGGS
jgi:hypothetical protein